MNNLESPGKLIHISVIWLLPILLVILESALFITKSGWQSHNIIYYISFWGIRILLTPLIIYFTRRFWVEHTKKTKLIVTHLIGFLLFSLVFTTIAYFTLQELLSDNDFPFIPANSSKAFIYGVIADNSISINLMVYLSTVIIYYTLEYSRRVVIANQRSLELERSLVTSRLDVLQNQLNTHFLFNTLHTINSLVVREEKEDASEMIIKLSDLLRFALRENQEQLISVATELEMLQTYIDIIMARFGNKLEIKIIAEKKLFENLIPAFVLQPLVENAIRHAVEPLSSGGKIIVQIDSSNQHLTIKVTDNGEKAFSTINFSNGIGLKNTKERLQKLYGEDHKITFQPNEGDGITVCLKLPLQTSLVSKHESINS